MIVPTCCRSWMPSAAVGSSSKTMVARSSRTAREIANALPDVQAISKVSSGRSGRDDLQLLDCLGRFGSIREIASALHMHHSSVAYRLSKMSDVLGYDPRTPEGQYRARTALLLWHLHAH
jgi:hypothetical protein